MSASTTLNWLKPRSRACLAAWARWRVVSNSSTVSDRVPLEGNSINSLLQTIGCSKRDLSLLAPAEPHFPFVPAKAGIQGPNARPCDKGLGPRLRGDERWRAIPQDRNMCFLSGVDRLPVLVVLPGLEL